MNPSARAKAELRDAATHHRQAKRDLDNARERRDWMLWENRDRLTRKRASEITGLSLPGVQAAIKRGQRLAEESAAS